MRNVWFAIPSARSANEAGARLWAWRDSGYKIALWRDSADRPPIYDRLMVGPYPGYANAVNRLVRAILVEDPTCEWIVTGGDDTLPDPDLFARRIAMECTAHFKGTFGVMQPTGDRWSGGQIDRICGSPWLGREFCERINQGNGPLWPEYLHMFVDEELLHVSRSLGILWQRPDLTQKHEHFTRQGESVDWSKGRSEMPEFLREANSPEHWHKYSALFNRRGGAGFPGHEPLPGVTQ